MCAGGVGSQQAGGGTIRISKTPPLTKGRKKGELSVHDKKPENQVPINQGMAKKRSEVRFLGGGNPKGFLSRGLRS